MGGVLVSLKRLVLRLCSDVDALDTAAVACRPIDVRLMESLDPMGFRLHRRCGAVGSLGLRE